MKIICILLSMISFLIASEVKRINSIDDLSSKKDIILMFSIPSCPWCTRQLKILNEIKNERDIQIVKVEKKSKIYNELVSKYPFPVDFYPTSFIVTKDGSELNIEYEFQGYQKKNNIIKVLKSYDEF